MNYKGWSIWAYGVYWSADRFGVSMRGNSIELIKTMIDLKEPLRLDWKSSKVTGRNN